ncbi:hypothetical protein [Calditerricola satsumensis]
MSDFFWNQTQVIEYAETELKAVIVPAKKQTDLERVFLQFTYDTKQNKLGKPIIMKLNRYNANDYKHFSMTYTTLDNQPIVGLFLDFETPEARKVEYTLNSEVSATGYWDCVQSCLRNTWNKMPTAWRIVCEGACGGCIWSRVPHVCAGCLVCLAGYGIGCGTACL